MPSEQIMVIRDGDDILIRVSNGAKNNGMANVLQNILQLNVQEVKKVEHLDEPQTESVFFNEGPYAGMTPLEVLLRDGAIRLMEFNLIAAKYKNSALSKKIIEDIKTYLQNICKEGYNCESETRESLLAIMSKNDKLFDNYIKQLCASKGVSNAQALYNILDDVQLKGAVTCCVEAFAKKVTNNS